MIGPGGIQDNRLLRFAAVGFTCFLLQFYILKLLQHVGVAALLANAIGFVVSAQVNFLLSSNVTWSDASRPTGMGWVYRWFSFMGVVTGALVVNSTVFHFTKWVGNDFIRVASATATSTSLTFIVNHYAVFRPSRRAVPDET